MFPEIDGVFSRWDRDDSPGCALAVVRAGAIVHARGYGMADLEHGIPITPGSVFHAASLSKQFTAASIVLLLLRGAISLDDPVRMYVPELPLVGRDITIRHLIHHTSGLRDQWNALVLAGFRFSEDVIRDEDVMQWVSRMRELNFAPGDMAMYCNTGYTLLAHIVQSVSGMTLREFTDAEIFQPLGMASTHFRDDHREIVKNIAYGYEASPRGGWRASLPHLDVVGASGLVTTVEDLARWDANFYTPRVGGEAMVRQMMQPFRLNNGEEIEYRFGLRAARYRGLPIVEHAGADAGYRAQFTRFPEQRVSVICLCNMTVRPQEWVNTVADTVLKLPKQKSVSEKPIAENVESRAGLYWNSANEEIRRIRYAGGQLTLLAEGREVALVALGAGRFKIDALSEDLCPMGELVFECDEILPPPPGLVAIGAPGQFRRVTEAAPTTAESREYAGVYYCDELETQLRVELRGDALTLLQRKFAPAPMVPTFTDAFVVFVPQQFTSVTQSHLRFERGKDDRITGLRFTNLRIRGYWFARVNPPG